MAPSASQGYWITDIRRARLNGRNVKIFKAYLLDGFAYVFVGEFSAPVRTANRDLWKVAASSRTTDY